MSEPRLDLSEMQPLSKWRPTAVDHSPCWFADGDRREWLVAPCAHTRDSETLAESNWASMLKALEAVDPSGEDHETHRFGHWGPGWYEIAIVRPGSAAHHEAVRLEMALADYCVLDESDYSERDHEAQLERLEQIIRDIDRDLETEGCSDDVEWDHEAMASEVSGELPHDLSELTSRATEQVTAILVKLGYLATV